VRRIQVATPFPVLAGIYLLCFIFILLWTFFAADRTLIIDSLLGSFIWADAFIRFMQYFIAIHCAGMLIAFSLFVRRNRYAQSRVLFRFMSAIILTLIVITALYVFVYETAFPVVYAYKKNISSISSFSAELYKGAGQKEAAGAYTEALQYIDLSLSMDRNNPEKINKRLEIIKNLTPKDLHAYEQQKTGGSKSIIVNGEDVQSLLKKAELALDQKDYPHAYSYAESVLMRDSTNKRAMWISNIAWEEISANKVDTQIEKSRYLINEKRNGYDAYLREDYIKAYYIFKALQKLYPDDTYVQYYLNDLEEKLPTISFFTDEADLILSLPGTGKNYLLFFNNKDENNREIISIDRIVTLKDGTFFKNIETLGFLKDGTILYHYTVPYGKLIDHYININNLPREQGGKNARPSYLAGVPPLDKVKGIKLNVNPLDFSYYELNPDDLKMMSIWQLIKAMGIARDYANLERILLLELIFKIALPFMLLIFSLVCARIALSQSSAYISSPPRIIYLLIPIIPFIVLFIADTAIYIYKIIIGFIYFSLGSFSSILIFALAHLFIIALLFYGIARRLYKESRKQAS
jgi:hypothetical protein